MNTFLSAQPPLANDHTTSSEVTPRMQTLTLVTQDGTRLGAKLFFATSQAKANLIVSAATAVPQSHYKHFAVYAASKGFNVLTFDYRGIGESLHGDVADIDMSYLDWGRYDLAAAVETMSKESLPLFVVGHSYGGHAMGMLPNPEKIHGAYSFGSGAGWAGYMKPLEALKVRILWNLVLPPLVKWKGYMAWSLIGMGADMPYGVYRDWKRWCKNPRYFFDDPDYGYLKETYARNRFPLIAATATDDEWAPPASRDAFCKHFINSKIKLLNLEPQPGKTLGHMGYFKKDAEPYWQAALQWFEGLMSA